MYRVLREVEDTSGDNRTLYHDLGAIDAQTPEGAVIKAANGDSGAYVAVAAKSWRTQPQLSFRTETKPVWGDGSDPEGLAASEASGQEGDTGGAEEGGEDALAGATVVDAREPIADDA